LTNPSLYTIEALQRGLGVLAPTLESSGYLEKDPNTKRYRPGLKVLQLGFTAISSLEFRQVAHPYLSRLSTETNETVSLGVLDEMEVVYVDRVRARRMIVGVILGLGSRIPAHCASLGKVLLAFLPADELKEKIYQSKLTPCTINSINDYASLERELARVREQGYATNNEELESGLRAVAAPIWNHNQQVVVAINVSGSVRNITPQRIEHELAPKVCDVADQISQSLGYGGAG
jgi:DNA-binding IclR family transcriptional regulator